jgi:predicted kinase
MTTFIMMVGLVGSGKSTQAQKLSEKYDANIHSSDAIREELSGDINNQDINDLVFRTLHKRIKEDLRNGKNCIYDATNIGYKRRMAFLRELASIPCEKICVLMATPYKECLKNNTNRSRVVPKEVVQRMYYNFQPPHYFEGWDDIKISYKNQFNKPSFNRGAYESMLRYYMKGFNQNNPHHIHNLYDHSKALAFQYDIDDIKRVAAILHDCRKKEVETRDECGISHYYNHANVSAYYVLTHPNIANVDNNKDFIDVLFYITYHMLAHDIKSNKAIKKYEGIFGSALCHALMEFAERDGVASNGVKFNEQHNNIYIVKSDIAIGYTRLGDPFVIDAKNIEITTKYAWCIKDRKSSDKRLVSMSDGSILFLHRLIMNVTDKDIVVDHINHDQTDNRKENLRLCSAWENSMNTSLSKNNTSGVNGVSQMKNGRYRAYINFNHKQIPLGCYGTLEEAKDARHRASVKLYGEFANLNI